MAWDVSVTWVNGSVPTAANFNAYFRDNLKYLKGTGETVTARDLVVYADSFGFLGGSDAQFRHTYDPTGSEFQFLGEKYTSPTGIANNHMVHLAASLADSDGNEEILGVWTTKRVSSGNGTLAYYPSDGAVSTTPALLFNASGYIGINQATAAYRLDVAGTVNAARYRQAGSVLGTWALDGADMTYTGNARATGQLTRTTAGAPLAVTSLTVCTNLNVGKLRGFDWIASAATQAAGGVVAAPETWADYGYTDVCTTSITRSGWYLVLGELAGTAIEAGDSFAVDFTIDGGSGLDGGQSYVRMNTAGMREQARLARLVELQDGDVLALQCRSYTENSLNVTGSIVAAWLAPSTTIRPAGISASTTFGTATVTVT